MKCLHICNDFHGSKVHSNLYEKLDDIGLTQIIYNPIKKTVDLSKNLFSLNNRESTIVPSKPLKNYHRILFRNKISYLKKDVQSKVNLSEINVIHATTLFSDGALAYELSMKYNIPFISAVRTTDLNVFLKYRIDLNSKCLKIIRKASKLIFISDTLKNQFLSNSFIKKHFKEIEKKCIVKYNGIDDFWLNNIVSTSKVKSDVTKIIYVGSLIPRKNVINLTSAVLKLNQQQIRCELSIIGGGGSDEIKIKQISSENPEIIKYLGPISDKKLLAQEYAKSDFFAMPSIIETFGLVYIEALSQGLPLLYSKNDGIDGVFDINIGEKCNNRSLDDITINLQKLISNSITYEIEKIDFSIFNWKNIAISYLDIYKSI
ncbi:glycosyltransferase family 4 protein [Cellulophaga sp. E6(2014)]|uniref:glycosyltransferase family 4 protein n=1 Tax=Cellulophaga sp. E6(2014) TaxID=1495334 RepID=UPI00051D7135|nr:glycosyltransferase family 4 protein [Cellulophaga sp. E6(2014)]KGK29133.1 hypothetical protein EL45_17950 [Cellulophaga sp. E6(2014)]